MLSLLLLLVVTQVPCASGEMSLVCYCKQGQVTACQVLKENYPKRFKELEQALQAAKLAEQRLQQKSAEEANTETAASSNTPEPSDCKGQEHHIISRPIAEALEKHLTLRGKYQPRDPRFVSQAKDQASHCGYQDWHRKVDAEVIAWLQRNGRVTTQAFEHYLRELYRRPDLRARFPDGF